MTSERRRAKVEGMLLILEAPQNGQVLRCGPYFFLKKIVGAAIEY